MDFSAFIKKHGFARVAEIVGLEEVAVRSMASRNKISRDHWPKLLLAVPELGLNDLLAMETISKTGA